MNGLQTSQVQPESLFPALISEDTTKVILAAIGSCTAIALTYILTKNDYSIHADINPTTRETHFAFSKSYSSITD